jgi:NMD protein affecting ribosome stability and mRNA decay
MMSLNVCQKCGSYDLRKSRVKTVLEWLFSALASPYRCKLCDHRELKFNGMEVARPSGQITVQRSAT